MSDCSYPIHEKTAKPIKLNVFVISHMTPGNGSRMDGLSLNLKLSLKSSNFRMKTTKVCGYIGVHGKKDLKI